MKLAFKPCGIKKETIQQMHVELVRMSGKLHVKELYPEVVKACRGHFDIIMTCQFIGLKASGVTIRVFLRSYNKSCALVMDVNDANAVLQAVCWLTVTLQIARLTSGSLLGRTLFGFADNHTMGAQYSTTVDELLGDLFKLDKITQANIDAVKVQAAQLKSHA